MRRTLFKNEYLDDILPSHKRASIKKRASYHLMGERDPVRKRRSLRGGVVRGGVVSVASTNHALYAA